MKHAERKTHTKHTLKYTYHGKPKGYMTTCTCTDPKAHRIQIYAKLCIAHIMLSNRRKVIPSNLQAKVGLLLSYQVTWIFFFYCLFIYFLYIIWGGPILHNLG